MVVVVTLSSSACTPLLLNFINYCIRKSTRRCRLRTVHCTVHCTLYTCFWWDFRRIQIPKSTSRNSTVIFWYGRLSYSINVQITVTFSHWPSPQTTQNSPQGNRSAGQKLNPWRRKLANTELVKYRPQINSRKSLGRFSTLPQNIVGAKIFPGVHGTICNAPGHVL